ncbi:MAG TPA: response regulator [Roseiarcus sp.]|nr:response regulator [Roseiarcus sp.]
MMAEASPSARPVVLVVEDEPVVRFTAAAQIRNAGFRVIEAGSADEAIDILNARDDIRVVFTDIEMPGTMDGLRLARVVREKWPPVELIVTSGRRRIAEADLPSRGRFIEKPYTERQLIDSIIAFVA